MLNIASKAFTRISQGRREYVYWELGQSGVYVITTTRSRRLIREENSRNVLFGRNIETAVGIARIEDLQPVMDGHGAAAAYGSYWHACQKKSEHATSSGVFVFSLRWPLQPEFCFSQISVELFPGASLVTTLLDPMPVRIEHVHLLDFLRPLLRDAEDALGNLPI
jgi:hypothetical protein